MNRWTAALVAVLLVACEGTPPAPPTPSPRPPRPDRPALVVPAGTVLRLHLVDRLLSSYQHRGDLVIARLDEDVRVGDRVAIVRGSELRGVVTAVDEKGKPARLAFRLDRLMRASREVPIALQEIDAVGTGSGPRGKQPVEPAKVRGPLASDHPNPVATLRGQAIDLPAGLPLEVRLAADLRL